MTLARTTRTGWAFAPGHVTGIFSPVLGSRDPRGRGSVGAGLVLDAGVIVRAEWRRSTRSVLRMYSDVGRPLPIPGEVARRLLARRPGYLRVGLTHELPVGQGFGMSAAGALATGLAVAMATGDSRRHAIETAHLADLYGGGGLGGVSAILGGGIELRERPGIPPWGRIKHFRTSGTVFVVVMGGPMPSPSLLRDSRFLARVEHAAAPGLTGLGRKPSFSKFLLEAERFTDSLRLGPPSVLRLVHALRAPDTKAAQAMFGRSLFAVPRTSKARFALIARLTRLGLHAAEVPLATRGARALQGAPRGRGQRL